MKYQPLPKIRVERKPEVLQKTGFSRSTLYARIKDKLFVPPISLGARAVGWLAHETDAVLMAMISGQTNEQIQALVTALVNKRKPLNI